MLFQKRKQRREAQGNDALASHNDPSVFPLAVPLISATTYFNKYLSPTFIDVVTRILGKLFAALATQFIMDGIHSFNEL